jgi:hypothetical protein
VADSGPDLARAPEPEAPVEAQPVAEESSGRAGLQTLDSGYDLSSLVLDEDEVEPETPAGPGANVDAGAAPAQPRPRPEPRAEPRAADQAETADSGLQPAAGLRYLGGIRLVEGQTKQHDFGLIPEGEARETTFQFVSDGKEPLVIKGVKPSCGCTKAEIELHGEDGKVIPYERGAEIPVGAKFQLLTEISTEGKKGVFGAQVTVFTNAPGGNFNVRLMAEVEPLLDITPDPTLYFGQMTTADRSEKKVNVKSRKGQPFKLTVNKKTLPKNVALQVVPVSPGDDGRSNEWNVTVVAGPGLPIGIRNYPCQVSTDIEVAKPKFPNQDGSAKYHQVPLAVQARVIGMVHAEPAFVGFGMIRPGEVVERVVRIQSNDDYQLAADTLVTMEGLYGGEFEYADLFTTTLEPVEEGKSMDLRVRLEGLPDEVNGSFGGILKVAVGHPSMKDLTIRFSGVCRAGLPGGSRN